jgi:hypothetical protein
MQLHTGCVRRGGLVFQRILGYHCLLVDVMNICKVAAKGARFHPIPALVALHIVGVPFSSCDRPVLHPEV